MNPIDVPGIGLPGPEFLLLYTIVGAGLVGGFLLYRYLVGAASGPDVSLSDPYEIAFLRGGRTEMLQLATLSLVDRGYLTVDGNRVRRENDFPGERIENPLEKIVLAEFTRTSNPVAVFGGDRVEEQCRAYQQSLVNAGAWLSDQDQNRVQAYRWIVFLILTALAGNRVGTALLAGRTNVLYLVVLALVFAAGTHLFYRHRRTSRGSRYLRHLQSLVESAREAHGEELLMLGAVMGVTALPGLLQSYSVSLFHSMADKRRSANDGGAHGDSSSCGSGDAGDGGGVSGCGGCGSN